MKTDAAEIRPLDNFLVNKRNQSLNRNNVKVQGKKAALFTNNTCIFKENIKKHKKYINSIKYTVLSKKKRLY